MPRVKKAISQISAATTARMNSHLITTTARTMPSTTSAASRTRRMIMNRGYPPPGSLIRLAERDLGDFPQVQLAPSVACREDRLAVFVHELADASGALLGPPRQALGLLLRSAPEEARPLEVAARERDLREARERVERPEPVLLRAFHLERDEPFSLGLVEIAAPQPEHQELVPLARLPPRPARRVRHLGAAPCQLDRALNIAVDNCELTQQPVVRCLDEGEPALGELEGMFGQLSHAIPVLPPPGRYGEHLLDDRDPSVIAELPVKLGALLVELHGQLVVAGEVGGAALRAQHLRAKLRRDVSRAVAEPLDPLETLLWPGRVPELLQVDRELEPEARIVLLRPVERGAQVFTLRQRQAHVRLHVVRSEMGVAGNLEHSLGVTPAQVVLASRLAEPLVRELADGLEHPVALLTESSRAAAEEALVEERGERVEVGVTDQLRRLERAAAAEHAEAREEHLLVLVEQVVRPDDGRPQRRVALFGIAGPLECVEPVGEALEERLRGEQLGARGGELERERQAVEPLAELHDGVRGGDVGPHSLGALAEERHGLVARERWKVELRLALDPEGLAAGGEQPQCGNGGHELGQRTGGAG